jgi:hypothetical protein
MQQHLYPINSRSVCCQAAQNQYKKNAHYHETNHRPIKGAHTPTPFSSSSSFPWPHFLSLQQLAAL